MIGSWWFSKVTCFFGVFSCLLTVGHFSVLKFTRQARVSLFSRILRTVFVAHLHSTRVGSGVSSCPAYAPAVPVWCVAAVKNGYLVGRSRKDKLYICFNTGAASFVMMKFRPGH